MEGIELLCFEIICNVGDARSSFIQAISEAKAGNYEAAEKLVAAGEVAFEKGHEVHGRLIQQSAAGEDISFSLLLVHAEDQLMSAEAFKILCGEFIDLYKRVDK